jgi:outer membrane protein assembly factor BamB
MWNELMRNETMHSPSRRPIRTAWLAVSLAAALTTTAVAAEPSWPRFRGAGRDNLSTETGLLNRWPDGGPKLVWKARGVGHGYSTVAIAGGLIYTTGNVEGKTLISALDMAGKVRWRVENGPSWDEPMGGTRGTPTINGDRLYHENAHGDVVCLDAKTGKWIWGLNILEEFGGTNIRWGLAESLLIDGDRVICSPGGPKTAVVALDKRTGRTVWQSPSAGDLAGYASPTLAQQAGLRMILTMTARAAIGVNADTGELLWRFEHLTPFDENVCIPIYHDGRVFFSTQLTDAVQLEVTVTGRKASVRPAWRSGDLDNHHGGVLLVDGFLYGSCHSPKWACLDWTTGQTKYQSRGVGKGSLTYADGMLYTFGEGGHVALVSATPDGHEPAGQFRVPEGGSGPGWAHPVVCGGRLYIRHSDLLFAYDVRAR